LSTNQLTVTCADALLGNLGGISTQFLEMSLCKSLLPVNAIHNPWPRVSYKFCATGEYVAVRASDTAWLPFGHHGESVFVPYVATALCIVCVQPLVMIQKNQVPRALRV